MEELPAPQDHEPGFRPDPATDGRYHRWWSGTSWGDATRPVGGPTLADVEAGRHRSDPTGGPWLAPVSRRATIAVAVGLVVALLGVRMLVPEPQMVVDVGQQVTGWVLVAVGALVAQAGLVGFVLSGVVRAGSDRAAQVDEVV